MKKIILTLAACCFLIADAAGQEIEWQNTIGGSGDDHFTSMKATLDKGYILGGFSLSGISGDKSENCLGGYDYWVVKTDSLGNIQWQNTIGGSDDDMFSSLHPTMDGGYILGGTSVSNISGDKVENCIGSFDYWIMKIDSTGMIQWQNTIGGNSHDQFSSIQQTSDGGYILAGWSWSDISSDKTENSNGDEDFWIVKTDSIGNIEWQNTIGGNGHDDLYSIQQTTDMGFILGGWSTSGISGDKTESLIGQWDYWIVKTDSIGNIQWQNTIGGSGVDELQCVQQTSDGGYIIGGYSNSNISGDKTENGNGVYDYWVVKLDSSGNIQWQNTIGGSNEDQLYSIKQTSEGSYMLGGLSYSNISGDKTENSYGMSDYWILKIDTVGNIIRQNRIGGNSGDWLFSTVLNENSSYVLGGLSYSNISADKNENNHGGKDYWIMKLTDDFNSITGQLFFDANSNSMQDIGEFAVGNNMITEINTSNFSFSQQNGFYAISVLDSGNFSVFPSTVNYYNAVPATHNAYFSSIHQTDSLNDFAFQPSGVFNDLCVTITPMGNFRANMNANYMVNYENVGTTTLNGTVIFFPDNDVTFVSSNPTATSVTTDSAVWNVGTLTPFQTGSILVTVHVNGGTPTGTLINSSVVIEPVAGDANTACNYNSWEVFVTGSYDPNAILVDRDTVLTTELSNPPFLNYIIYFQNTGNDTAFNAKVLNNIPQRADINSFEFVASSHPVNITYGAHARLITFTFDNILLPDSNINEPASHGFIRYRIKPLDTLVAGNKIFNKAFIYFDFNEPVQTNYAITEIVLPTGMGKAAAGSDSKQLMIYPNPVREVLIVNSYSVMGKEAGIKIYDLFGREVFQLQTASCKLQTQIDVSSFSQGIYFVELQSGEQVLRGKFLKQ